MKTYTLRRPEWLTLTVGGKPHCGYDQEWYPDPWQQKAGCGPTTGAAIAAYIEAKTRGIRPADKEAALAKMQAFWPYAAPRRHGLYKTRWLMEGLAAYLRDQGLPGRADMFCSPCRSSARSGGAPKKRRPSSGKASRRTRRWDF